MLVWVQVPSPALIFKRLECPVENHRTFSISGVLKRFCFLKRKMIFWRLFLAVIFGGEALCSPFFMDRKQQTVESKHRGYLCPLHSCLFLYSLFDFILDYSGWLAHQFSIAITPFLLPISACSGTLNLVS